MINPTEYLEATLNKMGKADFYPVGFARMGGEDTFIFQTSEEAKKAYHHFERNEKGEWIGDIVGWWYGKEAWPETVDWYRKNVMDEEVSVFWLGEAEKK